MVRISNIHMKIETLIVSFLLLTATSVSAQSNRDNVAKSGMGQGEAVINVRSDVRLSIMGTKATPRENVNALGQAVGKKLPEIRACYAKAVAKAANITGKLLLTMDFAKKSKLPDIQFHKEQQGLVPIMPCVKKALKTVRLAPKNRPAAAEIGFDFQNTRAPGQELLEKRTEQHNKFKVSIKGDKKETQWTTEDGKVSFFVSGEMKVSDQVVTDVLRILRDRFGLFLDCRRRSSKRGLSPEGETDVDVRVQRKGKAKIKVLSSTVAFERAPICIERAFKKLKFQGVPAASRVGVKIRFQK